MSPHARQATPGGRGRLGRLRVAHPVLRRRPAGQLAGRRMLTRRCRRHHRSSSRSRICFSLPLICCGTPGKGFCCGNLLGLVDLVGVGARGVGVDAPRVQRAGLLACPGPARRGSQRLRGQGRPEAVAGRPEALDGGGAIPARCAAHRRPARVGGCCVGARRRWVRSGQVMAVNSPCGCLSGAGGPGADVRDAQPYLGARTVVVPVRSHDDRWG